MDICKGVPFCYFPLLILSMTNGYSGNLFHCKAAYSHRTANSVRVFVFCNKSELNALFLMEPVFSAVNRENETL
jgi:hypothetical protein